MIFNASERKAVFILIFLITGIFILPRHFKASEPDFFLLPTAIEEDSIIAKKDTLSPIHTHTFPQKKVHSIPLPLDLNRADSTTLVRIRGIGPY